MPPKQPEPPWKRRVFEGASHAEEEAHRLMQYINEEVVPEVRRNGLIALKAAAGELHRSAERMDRANREPASELPPKRL